MLAPQQAADLLIMGLENDWHKPTSFDIAIRLADEGVPVRAIARAVHIGADELRPRFEQAKLTGRLVDLPREDWPPGVPRHHRVPDLRPIAEIDEEVLKACVMQIFGITAGQARIMLVLIRRYAVPRAQMHEIYNQRMTGTADTYEKIIDVQICKMRHALKIHEIEIQTVWGFGYRMSTTCRRKALDLLLDELGDHEL
jgi:hypothetical protein